MSINYLILLISLPFLWWPVRIPKDIIHYRHNPPTVRDPHIKGFFGFIWNWFDFCRAIIGTFLLLSAVTSDPEIENAAMIEKITEWMILAVGIGLQVMKYLSKTKSWLLVAPICYLAGLNLGYINPWVSGFSLFAALMAVPASGTLRIILPVLTVSIITSGLLLSESIIDVGLLSTLNLLPISLGVMTAHRLNIACKKKSRRR